MTMMTESPLRNIFGMNRSLFYGLARFPLPAAPVLLLFGISVHISQACSRTMFMCLSKAFTLARILRLFRQLIKTCEFVFTAFVKSESGPSWKISSYGVCYCFACSTIKIKIIKFDWLSLNAGSKKDSHDGT